MPFLWLLKKILFEPIMLSLTTYGKLIIYCVWLGTRRKRISKKTKPKKKCDTFVCAFLGEANVAVKCFG